MKCHLILPFDKKKTNYKSLFLKHTSEYKLYEFKQQISLDGISHFSLSNIHSSIHLRSIIFIYLPEHFYSYILNLA